TWSRTSSCRCGSEHFIQKENFSEFTYRLVVLQNRVIYTKLLTHPKQLSLHNKIRLGPNALFGFKTFPIAYNSIRKRDRPQLLATLDKIMAYKENQTSENLIINDINHEPVDSQQYYMERYGLEPPTVLII